MYTLFKIRNQELFLGSPALKQLFLVILKLCKEMKKCKIAA